MESTATNNTPYGSPVSLHSLTPDKIRELAHEALDKTLAESYEQRLFTRATRKGFALDDREEEAESLSLFLSDLLEEIDLGGPPSPFIRKQADALLYAHSILPEPANGQDQQERLRNTAYLKLCDQLNRAGAACLESQLAGPCWNGELRKAPGWKVSTAESFIMEKQQAAAVTTQAPFMQPPSSSAPAATSGAIINESHLPQQTLKEAVDKFISIRKDNWTRKASAQDIAYRFQLFLKAVNGENLTCAQFVSSRDAMRTYQRILTSIPTRHTLIKEYKDMSLEALAALNVPQEKRFSREALRNSFNTIKGFLTWAFEEGYFPVHNIAAHKKILIIPEVAAPCERRAFTTDELKRLFAPEQFLTDKTGLDPLRPWKYWVPLIGLFTGARIEEISQLELADIKQDPEQGFWTIHITDEGEETSNSKHIKTKAGKRIVPLHPFLTREDSPANLIAYAAKLQGAGEIRLFPMLTENSRGIVSDKVSKWFTRYRRDCQVGEERGKQSDVAFHSFRHTAATRGKIKGVEQAKIRQALGHETKDPNDITTRYQGNYPVSIIYSDFILEALGYDEELNLMEILRPYHLQ